MAPKSKTDKKEKALDNALDRNGIEIEGLDGHIEDIYEESFGRQDEWLLKFEVNDKGVGRLLLPPSLSVLLQSDRVSIMPTSGGLFIRSV